MTSGAIVLGILLGALGGAAHLAVTRWRAGLASSHGAFAALIAFPLGFVGPAAAVLVAARIAPLAAWTTLIGIVAVRWGILRAVRGRAR